MKKSQIKSVKTDSMLYQKTNEDFNNEKPNPLDSTQIKVHPIEDEAENMPTKKSRKNK